MKRLMEILHAVAFFFLTFEKSLNQSDKSEILSEIKKLRNQLRSMENECTINLTNKEQEKVNAK